jgi:hypothetical protein
MCPAHGRLASKHQIPKDQNTCDLRRFTETEIQIEERKQENPHGKEDCI